MSEQVVPDTTAEGETGLAPTPVAESVEVEAPPTPKPQTPLPWRELSVVLVIVISEGPLRCRLLVFFFLPTFIFTPERLDLLKISILLQDLPLLSYFLLLRTWLLGLESSQRASVTTPASSRAPSSFLSFLAGSSRFTELILTFYAIISGILFIFCDFPVWFSATSRI